LDSPQSHISHIVEAGVYFDRTSFEESTGQVNRKYKVLGKKAYNYFVFFIFTSCVGACARRFTVIIKKTDLIDRKPRHLENEQSYIDASKPESLETNVVHKKTIDPHNRFEAVARMKTEKLELIIRRLNEAWQCGARYQFAPRRIQEIELAYRAVANATVKALGLD
jgi:hypothetical protein